MLNKIKKNLNIWKKIYFIGKCPLNSYAVGVSQPDSYKMAKGVSGCKPDTTRISTFVYLIKRFYGRKI